MVGRDALLALVEAGLVCVVVVDLLHEHREGRLCGLTNLLIDVLALERTGGTTYESYGIVTRTRAVKVH